MTSCGQVECLIELRYVDAINVANAWRGKKLKSAYLQWQSHTSMHV